MRDPDVFGRPALMSVLAVAGALLMAGMAQAGEPLSADEFDAYVTGRTLIYNSGGQPYGIEEYLPGRRVRWAFTGDDCVEGYWYAEQGLICFSYEANPEPQCWTFEAGSSGLIARFQGLPGATELYETHQSAQPMACYGPKVGS